MLNNKLLRPALLMILCWIPGLCLEPVLRAADEPVMVISPERFDFGEILSGEEIEKSIRLENQGKADLHIKKIQFSCGCTLPEMLLSTGETRVPDRKNPDSFVALKPGEWAQVKLLFQTIGKFGDVTHRMDLYTNDPEGHLVSIPIHAQVRRAFKVDPVRADFGLLDKHAEASRTLTIQSNEVGPFKILGIDDLPRYLAYSVEEVEGEIPACKLILTYKGGAPAGVRSARLKVHVENEQVKDFALFFNMHVFPAVIFSHQEKRIFELINLGLLERGEEKTAELAIISTDPKRTFHITNLTCRSKCTPKVKAELITDEDGKRYRVVLTVSSQVKDRVVSGSLLLETDHPDLPKTAIRFRGIYKEQ